MGYKSHPLKKMVWQIVVSSEVVTKITDTIQNTIAIIYSLPLHAVQLIEILTDMAVRIGFAINSL